MSATRSIIISLIFCVLMHQSCLSAANIVDNSKKDLTLPEFLDMVESTIDRDNISTKDRDILDKYLLSFVVEKKVDFTDLAEDILQYKEDSRAKDAKESSLSECEYHFENGNVYSTAFLNVLLLHQILGNEISVKSLNINNTNVKPSLLNNKYIASEKYQERRNVLAIGDFIPCTYVEQTVNELASLVKKSGEEFRFYTAFIKYLSQEHNKKERVNIVLLKQCLLKKGKQNWVYKNFFRKTIQKSNLIKLKYDEYEKLVKSLLCEIRKRAVLNLCCVSDSIINTLIISFSRKLVNFPIPFDITKIIELYIGFLSCKKVKNLVITKGKHFGIDPKKKHRPIFIGKTLNQDDGFWVLCYEELLKESRKAIINNGEPRRRFGGGGLDLEPFDYRFTIQIWDSKNTSFNKTAFQQLNAITLNLNQNIFSTDYYSKTFSQEPYFIHLQKEEYLLISLRSKESIFNSYNAIYKVDYCSVNKGRITSQVQSSTKYYYRDIACYFTEERLLTFAATSKGIYLDTFNCQASGLNLFSQKKTFLLPSYDLFKVYVDRNKKNVLGIPKSKGVLLFNIEKPNLSCNLMPHNRSVFISTLDIRNNHMVLGEYTNPNAILLDTRVPYKSVVTYSASQFSNSSIQKINFLTDENYIMIRYSKGGCIFDRRYNCGPIAEIGSLTNSHDVFLKGMDTLLGVQFNVLKSNLYYFKFSNKTTTNKTLISSLKE